MAWMKRGGCGLLAGLALAALQPDAARAAEGGAGFYLLGSKSELAGVVPPPGTYAQFDFYFYSGSASADLPYDGKVQIGLDADALITLSTVMWVPDTGTILGGRPFATLTVPMGWKGVDVNAQLTQPGGTQLHGSRGDRDFLLGDPVLGAGLGWGSGPWFGTTTILVNVPAGDYSSGRLSNVAFHRWATDISSAVTWLDAERGYQANLTAGLTFNGENTDTNYTSGNEFHLEASLTKAINERWGIGFYGYHYEQISGDSGEGAVLGDFKGRVDAFGPGVNYQSVIGGRPVSMKAHWFHEFNTRNRVEGDAVYLTLAFPF